MSPARHSWRDIGTLIEVGVSRGEDLDLAVEILARWVHRVDAACSRFRSDSELSTVARDGAPHPISELLTDLIGQSVWAFEFTQGVVDPTVASCMNALGYDRDFDAVRRGAPEPTPKVAPGLGKVKFDSASRTLALPPGVDLDLGATAKARLADMAAGDAVRRGVAGVLVNCGGDIAVAGEYPEDGWGVRLTDDCAGGDGPVINLRSGGLATSSTTVRRWLAGSFLAHHIVDPHTGLPAQGPYRTVSVVATTCVVANAASTASLVMGARAPEWLAQRGLESRLVAQDDRVTMTGAWPSEGLVSA